MKNDCLQVVIDELQSAGLSYEIDETSKHVHVRYGPDRVLHVVAKTASDWRAVHNERALIRRHLREAGYIGGETEPAIQPAMISLSDGRPVAKSTEIAAHFDKQHKNVLAAIDAVRIQCGDEFDRLNFQPIEYLDAKGRKYRAYEMTRDGFALVAMGFTGAKATAWKVKYIAAFNAMEGELRGLAKQNDVLELRRDMDAMFDLLTEATERPASERKRVPVIPASILRRRAVRRARRKERAA